MPLLAILHYPDPRLTKISAPVSQFDDALTRLVDDMLETMYAAPGIGLAAPQVDVLQRIIVIDISEDKSQPLCLVNPEIISMEGEIETEEGCLSVPAIYENVSRAERVSVKACDQHGKALEFESTDLLAVCIQHEIDHLDGKLFVDYLSDLKRQRIRKKMQKLSRRNI